MKTKQELFRDYSNAVLVIGNLLVKRFTPKHSIHFKDPNFFSVLDYFLSKAKETDKIHDLYKVYQYRRFQYYAYVDSVDDKIIQDYDHISKVLDHKATGDRVRKDYNDRYLSNVPEYKDGVH